MQPIALVAQHGACDDADLQVGGDGFTGRRTNSPSACLPILTWWSKSFIVSACLSIEGRVMVKSWLLRSLFAAGIFTASVSVFSRERDPVSHQQIMLLGSYHLANNNRDLINLAVDDVLTSHRQREMDDLVHCLAGWQPTRIAVEWDRSDQVGLDRRYANFLAGDYEPTANEIDQIGLRLARQLGHDRVYAADWNEAAPGDQMQYDFIDWAEQNNQGGRFAEFVAAGQREADTTSAKMRGQSVGEWYFDLNDPESRKAMHKPYFDIATFGSNEENPGAAWVGAWYARNLRIFNNIREILAPRERVMVLYGAGHIHLLDQFLKESGAAVTVDPRPFTKCQ